MASIEERMNRIRAGLNSEGAYKGEVGTKVPASTSTAGVSDRISRMKADRGIPAVRPTPALPTVTPKRPRWWETAPDAGSAEADGFNQISARDRGKPFNRFENIASGAIKGTGADFIGAAGLGLDTAAHVADSLETDKYDSAMRNIARFEKEIRSGRSSDGKPLTTTQKIHLANIISEQKKIARENAPKGTFETRQDGILKVKDAVESTGDKLAASSQKDIETAKDGLGKLGQFGVDVGVAGTQMLGDAVTLGLPGMFVRSMGGAARTARQAGGDIYDQLTAGIGSAAIGVATEKLGNVAAPFKAVYGNGIIDKVIPNVVNRLTKSKLGKLALSAISEGGEEFVEDIFQPIIQRASYDPNARFNLEEALYGAAVGAVLGGAGGAVDVVSNRTQEPKPHAVENATPEAPREKEAPGVQTAVHPAEAGADVTTDSAVKAPIQNEPVQAPIPNVQTNVTEPPVTPEQPPFAPPVMQTEPIEEAPAAAEATEANPSIGAADKSFDGGFAEFQSEADSFHPINQQAAERTAQEQGRAESEIPKVNPRTGKNIGKTVSTLVNSPLLSNDMAAALEGGVVAEKFDYTPNSDPILLAQAKQMIATHPNGYKGVIADYVAKTDGGVRISDLDNTAAALALSEASAAHDEASVFAVGEAMDSIGKQYGRVLRTFNFLNRLTPEGQLLTARRALERMNEQYAGKGHVDPAAKAAVQEVISKIEQERDDAIRVIQAMMDSFGEAPGVQDVLNRTNAGEGYSEMVDAAIEREQGLGWLRKIADALAKKAERNSGTSNARQRTVYEIVSGDLGKFLDQYLGKPASSPSQKRTAADRITDFFNNRAEYQKAWAAAKAHLENKYAVTDGMTKAVAEKNQAVLDRLEEFFNGGVVDAAHGDNGVMLRAIAEMAMENDVDLKELVVRGEYDTAEMARELADGLIQKTGATEAFDQNAIRQAASDFVDGKVQSAKRSAGEYVETDIKKAMRAISVRMGEVIRTGAKNKAELAKRISDMLVDEYHISPEGAQSIGSEVAAKFQSMVEESSRKHLESMFKERPKSVRKSVQEKFTELGNMGAFTDPNFNVKSAEKLFGVEGIEIDEGLAHKFLEAETDEQRADAWENILKDLAEKTPTTKLEKWNAIRYVNMLGNLRTLIGGNFVGNVAMSGLSTVNHKVNAALERIAGTERQHSFTTSKELRNAAAEYYETVKKAALGEQKYGDAGTNLGSVSKDVQEYKRIFGLKPLEGYRKGINWVMNNKYFGDEGFNRHGFVKAMAGYLKAQGVTAEQFSSKEWRAEHPDFVDKVTEFSIRNAQEDTFRDNNTLSEWVSKIGRRPDTPWYGRLVSEGLSPFRKTPTNVFVRMAEYSPVGAVTEAAKIVAGKVSGKGTPTGAEVVTQMSKALSGSALFAIGMALANAGVLRGKDDDDEDQAAFDRLQGHQEYALEVPGMESMTIGWLVPAAAPLLMGANLMQAINNGNGEWELKDFEDAVMSVSDVILETSMMQGLDETVNKFRYSDGSAIGQIALSVMLSYFAQGLTNSAVGQLSRLDKEDSMMTYVDKDSPVPPWLQKEIGKASRKMPGDGYQQTPYIDAWGRTESTGDFGWRLFNNTLNRAFMSDINTTAVEEELQRLYDAKGEGSVLPKDADHSFQVGSDADGKPIVKNLTKEEWDKYARERGQTALKTVSDLQNMPGYAGLSDSDKVKVTEEAYKYANAIAKSHVSEYKLEGTEEKISESELSPAQYIIYNVTKDRDGNKSTTNAEAAQTLLEIPGLSNEQRSNAWMSLRENMNAEKNPFTGNLAKAGVPPETVVDLMLRFQQLEDDKSIKTGKKPDLFVRIMVESGLDRRQQKVAQDTYKFYAHIPIKYR